RIGRLPLVDLGVAQDVGRIDGDIGSQSVDRGTGGQPVRIERGETSPGDALLAVSLDVESHSVVRVSCGLSTGREGSKGGKATDRQKTTYAHKNANDWS